MQGQITQSRGKKLQSEALYKVKIIFRESAFNNVRYLLGMMNSGVITMLLQDGVVLLTAFNSRKWEHEDDRTVVISLTKTFDVEHFIKRVVPGLENLEVMNQN